MIILFSTADQKIDATVMESGSNEVNIRITEYKQVTPLFITLKGFEPRASGLQDQRVTSPVLSPLNNGLSLRTNLYS